VAYDQRYFGASDWPDAGENFSVDTHSDDLIGFVEALEAGPVSVVSWSYGGDVVARAAVARPDLFHALVFYEPDVNGLIDSLPGSGEAVDQMLAGLRPAFAAVEEGRLEDAALRLIEGVFSMPEGDAKTEPEEILRIFRENSRAIPAFLAAPAGDRATCEELGNVRVPTLVVRGSDGFVLDAMVSERVVQCMPNAIIAILNGVTHDGPYRKPGVFAEMIDNFLKLFD
jgi:pimeloyl-ACP methyl ester carboxylesterase